MTRAQTTYAWVCTGLFILTLLIMASQSLHQFNMDLQAGFHKSIIPSAEEKRIRMCATLKEVVKDERRYVPEAALEKYCGKG